ncbi:MAG: hypothetical protein ACP5NB_01665 [Chloroflexia bacterium]
MKPTNCVRLRLLVPTLTIGIFLLAAGLYVQAQATTAQSESGTAVGIHLGSSEWQSAAWLDEIRGDQGGCWPEVVVILSGDVYNINRDANCRVSSVSVKSQVAVDYLRALPDHVPIIIRIYPSPGNFDGDHTLRLEPYPFPYGDDWKDNLGNCFDPERYRSYNDIGDEMNAIHSWNSSDAGARRLYRGHLPVVLNR